MKQLSRRSFLHNVSLSAGALALPSFVQCAPMPAKKLNLALCGLGRYAGYVAEGLAESSQYCKLAGIITGTPAKAEDWKKKYNIPQQNIYNYQTFDEVVNNKDIDLIYITLPNSMHKEYVLRAAKARKHIIVEKPMAITAKDCREMIDACKAAGVQLAVGYRLHYEPYNLEMKRLGQEKVFGQVRYMETSLSYRGSDPNEWRLRRAMSGGGPLMNIGIYCVQASRYVLGEEPVSVTAQFGPITNKELFKEVEESLTWQFNFHSGAVCNSSSSYSCRTDRLFAAADDGFFELSPAISYGPFKGRSSKGEFSFPEINQQATQCDEIAKVILDNKKLPEHISGEEGFKDMRLIEAIYESARTGRKITL